MAGINKVILLGRLGRDPEIRYTPEGIAVANFSIATSEGWRDKGLRERKEKTEWHRIVVWRKLGEMCGKCLFKGSQVYIEGKLKTRSWEQKGITRHITEVVATDVHFIDNKGNTINRDSGNLDGNEYFELSN